MTELRGDRRAVRSFAVRAVLLAGGLVLLGLLVGFTLGELTTGERVGAVLAVLVLVPLGVAAMSVRWWRDARGTAYVVTGTHLAARHRGRTVAEVPLADVEDVEVVGTMDLARMCRLPVFPPRWPHAVVTHRAEGVVRRTALPGLALWGPAAAGDAERELRRMLGLPVDPVG